MRLRRRIAVASLAVGTVAALGVGLPGNPASAHEASTPAPTAPPINCTTKYTVTVSWQAHRPHQFVVHVPGTKSWLSQNEPAHTPQGKKVTIHNDGGGFGPKDKKLPLLAFGLLEDESSHYTYSFSLRLYSHTKHLGSAVLTLSDGSTITIPAQDIGVRGTSLHNTKMDGWITTTGYDTMGAKASGGPFATKIAFAVCLK